MNTEDDKGRNAPVGLGRDIPPPTGKAITLVVRTVTGRVVTTLDAIMRSRQESSREQQRTQLGEVDYSDIERHLLAQMETMPVSVGYTEELDNHGPAKPRKQKAQWKRERNPFGRR